MEREHSGTRERWIDYISNDAYIIDILEINDSFLLADSDVK